MLRTEAEDDIRLRAPDVVHGAQQHSASRQHAAKEATAFLPVALLGRLAHPSAASWPSPTVFSQAKVALLDDT